MKPALRVSLQNIGYSKGLVLSFVLGFTVRMIPEILSFPHPIGFDTISYAAKMKSGIAWNHWSSLFSSWLLYAILIAAYQAVRMDPFLWLKLTAPLLFGLNVCGIYYFARKALGWKIRNALLAGGFFAFQLAALRLSWDLHRNTLGLAILLFTLPLIQKVGTWKEIVCFSLLSVLVIFILKSAQYFITLPPL